MGKAIVLLSGGVDSTTCLALAVKTYGKESVTALNIFYGQRHKKEIESARAVARFYGVDYHELDMTQVMALSDCSLLEHSGKEIKHGSYASQLKDKKTVETYVPFRNGLFLSAAASFALSVGAEVIMYGAHADDMTGSAYPDCSETFVSYMNNAILEGTANQVHIEAPFVNKTKAELVGEGITLGVPYELTWSCYEGGERPCGKCATCLDRMKAFEMNGRKDPALE